MTLPGAAARLMPEADIAALMPPAQLPAAQARWWRRWLPTLLGFFGGCIGGALVAMLAGRMLETLSPGAGLALLAGFFVSAWAHVVLHEAGHAIAGVSRGMRAIAFGVGPLRMERRGDGSWHWRNGGGMRGIGGFAALVPQAGRGRSRGDQMLLLLGGPLANLLTAAVLALPVLGLSLPPVVAAACTGAALAALVMGLGNLLPLHLQGWRSDGRGLLDLLRRTPDATLQLQISQLMALSVAGVRPRDWPDASLPASDGAIASAGLRHTVRLLRLSHALDRRDAAAARPEALALAAVFAEAPAALRSAVAVALASHAALLVGDRALVSAWRRHCEGGLLDLSPYHAWLDAEIARLDGDVQAVADHLGRARVLAARIPDAAGRLAFDERLEALAAMTAPNPIR